MSDTSPGSADQDQPWQDSAGQPRQRRSDRPEYGQPTAYPPPPTGQQPGQWPGYGQYNQQAQGGQPPGSPPSYQRTGWSAGAPAPGGIPLRPLGFGDMLSGTFTLIRQNPAATIGLIALGTLAGAILSIILSLIANHTGSSAGSALADIPAFVIDAAVGGGVLAALGNAFLGRKISIVEALQQSRVGWIILTGIGYWLMIALIWSVPLAVLKGFGFLIAFPLGAWLGIMLCLMFPIVVLERQNSWAAIGRSWQLVKGSFWRFFGIFTLLFVVVFALLFVLGLIFSVALGIGIASSNGNSALTGGGTIGTIIAFAILSFVISSVLVALWSALIVLLYADARMRKEGMDLVLQQAAQNQQLTGDEFASYVPASTGGGYPGAGGGYPSAGGGYQGGAGGGTGGYNDNPPRFS